MGSERERERYKADYGLCTIRVSHSLILPIGTMVRPITEVYIRLCPERRCGGWRMGDGVCRMRKASAELRRLQILHYSVHYSKLTHNLHTLHTLHTTDYNICTIHNRQLCHSHKTVRYRPQHHLTHHPTT